MSAIKDGAKFGTVKRSQQHLHFTCTANAFESKNQNRPLTSTMKQVSLQATPSIIARQPVIENGSQGHRRKTPMTARTQRQNVSLTATVKRPVSSTSVILDPSLPERVLFHKYRHIYAGKGGWYGNHCSRYTMAAGQSFCCDKCWRVTTGPQTSRTVSQVNDSRRTMSVAEQSLSLCLRGIALLPVATSSTKNCRVQREYWTQFQRQSVADERHTVIGNRSGRQCTGGQRDRNPNARSISNRKDNDSSSSSNNNNKYLGIKVPSSHNTAVSQEQLPAELDTEKVCVGSFNQSNENKNVANILIALSQSDDTVESHEYEGDHRTENLSTVVSCSAEWHAPNSTENVNFCRTGGSHNARHVENGIYLKYDDIIGIKLPKKTRCWSASTFSSLLSREGRQVMNEIRQEKRRTNVSPDSLFAVQQSNNQSTSNSFLTADDLHRISNHSRSGSGCLSFDYNVQINDNDDDNPTDREMSRARQKCSEWLNKRV